MLIALIVIVGLTPAIFSLTVAWYSRRHFQQSIQIAADYAVQERLPLPSRPRNPDAHYVDGMGLVIGDITCRLNAKSPFLRCAANPCGPCESCRDYEAKDYPPLNANADADTIIHHSDFDELGFDDLSFDGRNFGRIR